MQNPIVKTEKDSEIYFDLKELFSIFWKNRIIISSMTILLSILITFISYFSKSIHEQCYLALPGTSDLAQIAGQYSGIANLVGLDLGGSESDEVFQGIEIMKSLDFFEKIVNKNDLFYKLFASNGWNSKENSLKINKNFFSIQNNSWVYNGAFSKDGKPSMQSAHRKFMKKFSISRDKVTGIIYIYFEHYSPYVAKELLDTVIFEINEYKRILDRTTAEKTIEFLEKELEKTKFLNVKVGINGVIQRKMKKKH